jgi:hypothetical protein
VQTEEKHFGKDDNGTDIRYAAESALTQLGFTPVGNKTTLRYSLTLR